MQKTIKTQNGLIEKLAEVLGIGLNKISTPISNKKDFFHTKYNNYTISTNNIK